MTTLQVRMDDALKMNAQRVAESMGFDLPSLVRGFLTQMVRENRLPYQPSGDPFYAEENQRYLERSLDDVRHGRKCAPHELKES